MAREPNVGQDHEGPQHDAGRGHQRHVAILDVPDLVRDDSLQLVAIENLEQTDRDGHGRLVGIAADREGIGRRIIHDEHARHLGQLGRDRHLFHDVEQLRMVLLLDLARAGHLQQDVVALRAGEEPHHQPHAAGDHTAEQGAFLPVGEQVPQRHAGGHQQDSHGRHDEHALASITLNLFPHGSRASPWTRLSIIANAPRTRHSAEADFGNFAFRAEFDLEQLGPGEPTADQIGGKHLAGVVVSRGRVVVRLPGIADAVLRAAEFFLQGQVVLIGLQIRIGFGQGEQFAQRRTRERLRPARPPPGPVPTPPDCGP